MPALKDRHLVVSRSKDHREIYETVSEWLNTTNYFKWTDDSVTYNDELEGVELKRRRLLLRRRIETCSCVVLFAEMYEEYREWMDLVIDAANEFHKPLIRGKLDDIEKILQDYNFVRVQVSYLVNLKYVESVKSHTVYMKNGESFRISPKYREKIAQRMAAGW